MGFTYQTFDSLPSTVVADIKSKVLLSSDWSNPSGQVLKCTTPLGATMAVDLVGGGSPSLQGLLPTYYRTYATSSGTDPLTGYNLIWKAASSGALNTVPLHCVVVAGPTLLYIQIEGPRSAESFADVASVGSLRSAVGLSQITPYHTADTTPAVLMFGGAAYTGYGGPAPNYISMIARTSINQAGTAYWVNTNLFTMGAPSDVGVGYVYGYTPKAGDGSSYLFPYVAMEHAAGIRGRLTDLYYAGINRSRNPADASIAAAPGQVLTFGGNSYTIMSPYKGTSSGSTHSAGPLGFFMNNDSVGDYYRSPLVAVRTA